MWRVGGGWYRTQYCHSIFGDVTLLLVFTRQQQLADHNDLQQLGKMNLILGKGPVAAWEVQRQKKSTTCNKVYSFAFTAYSKRLCNPRQSRFATSVFGIITLRKNNIPGLPVSQQVQQTAALVGKLDSLFLVFINQETTRIFAYAYIFYS